MHHYSLLDLSPVAEGSSTRDALLNTVELGKLAEAKGYHRYWLAEHHNMPGIASAATALVIAQVAAATSTMRVGAGGIMLPNHSPLMVAEQFGTLEALYPDRIDLGLGRAPGTDMATARALRRHMQQDDNFPQDVVDLLTYFSEMPENAPVRAIPGIGSHVPVWILGSSLYGAQLAAYLGLPYAFASHFAPALLEQALETYRQDFRPSAYLEQPYAMFGAGVCVADTDEEAHYLRSSQVLTFARLRTGNPGKLPAPVENVYDHVAPQMVASAEEALSCSAVGSPETVHQQLSALIKRYQPDEIMVTGMIHNHQKRMQSFAMAADVLKDLVA